MKYHFKNEANAKKIFFKKSEFNNYSLLTVGALYIYDFFYH